MIDEHAIGLLTIAEAADIAGVAQVTIRQWIRRYSLPTTRAIDGRTLISERAILDCEMARRHARRGRQRLAS